LKIEAGHVSQPKVGEVANGDRPLCRIEEGGSLIAVIDALGHGRDAADVATTAVDVLSSVPLATPLLDVMHLLHSKLAGSRGAAGTICVLRDGSIEACAVGNVELRSVESRLPLVFSAGVLGGRVRKFHVCRAPLGVRSRFVLFSDGISSRAPLEDYRRLAPQAASEAIFQRHRRVEDDATVLVCDVEC
jgi:negative regulator of sigma-B (phosphoserine phosphatase)